MDKLLKYQQFEKNAPTQSSATMTPYGPSRAETDRLSLVMAEDLKEHHIDVNMLLPGGA